MMECMWDSKKLCAQTRYYIAKLCHETQAMHVWSALSCVEILLSIFCSKSGNDRVILSKWHAGSALYCTLCALWKMDFNDLLSRYCADGSSIWWHITLWTHEEIACTSGSLGHGLGIASGLAWDNSRHIYVVLWDGELNEWSVYESAAFIAQHNMHNVSVIIDKNDIQSYWHTKDIIDYEDLARIWEGLWFDVHSCDGHNMQELSLLIQKQRSRPLCIIAQTCKWKWLPDLESTLDSHYRVPSSEHVSLLSQVL